MGAKVTKYVRGLNLICPEGAAGASSRKFYLYNAQAMYIGTTKNGIMVSAGLGDVVQLTDSAGNVVKTYEYDAFGVEKNPSSGDTNPFRYCV
ncbi:MAG: hypothetical protein FWD39_00930 [Clostridiales bacterium]|nr:hypothetical protein [Clostridiales bacterium]